MAARTKKQKAKKTDSKTSNKMKFEVLKPKLWNINISLVNCKLHAQNEEDAISYANSALKTYFPNADIKVEAISIDNDETNVQK